jgi:hypothetical protein
MISKQMTDKQMTDKQIPDNGERKNKDIFDKAFQTVAII